MDNFNESDWVTQAEAARIRGVSRQAINNLIRNGRLKTIEIAGYQLVNRKDIETFEAQPAGRKKTSEQ